MTCVSTTTPLAMPKPEPRTTLPVLRATPGSVRISSIVLRDFAVEILDDTFAGAHDGFRFVAKEAGGADFLFEFAGIGVGEVFWRLVFLVERFGDFVHADVGALRGEDRGDQQLERVFVFQLAGCFGIGFVELLQNRGDPLWIGASANFFRDFRFGLRLFGG